MFFRKLFRNLQRQFWGDLAGPEGLDDVVALPAAGFSHRLLGVQHLLILPAGIAVEAGGEDLPVRLVPVQHIGNGLFQPGVPRQDFSDSH